MSPAHDYGACRNARPLPEGESTVVAAKRVLERAEAGGSGALVLQRKDSSLVGAILVERGRVCWAVCNDCPRRLSDMLVEESSSLTHAQVAEVVAECRRTHAPLGETLLSRGLVTQEALHRALLHHTSVSLDHLMRAESSAWTWAPHTQHSYSPMLTFSATEVLVGMSQQLDPERSAKALAVLRATSTPKQRALALQRAAGGRVPIAHLGCEQLELSALIVISRQADELLSVASIADLRMAVLEMDDLSFAAWGQDAVRYVLLCEGKLAFNRLLAHVVALNIS